MEDVIAIGHDAECGLVPYVVTAAEAEEHALEVLKLDEVTNRIVTRLLRTEDDLREDERNTVIDLLQYSFQLGKHFAETGTLDGMYPRSQLYLG